MNSLRTKSFTTIVLTLIGASFLAPSSSSATAEPVWGDGIAAVFGDGVPNVEYGPAGEVKSVSCASVGNCAAVGDFVSAAGQLEAFVMTSTDGEWSNATPVLFPGGTGIRGYEDVLTSVSCWSPGDCTAVGRFYNSLNRYQSFIVSSTDGNWATAQLVANSFGVGHSGLNSVSCSTAGDCTAVGYFANSVGQVPFIKRFVGGTWEGSTILDLGPLSSNWATLSKVSCASAGNCTAVGYFNPSSEPYHQVPFIVSSIAGEWGDAEVVNFPDDVHLDYPYDELLDVSCASAGNCTAVGYFFRSETPYIQEAFTVSSTEGQWGEADPVDFPDGMQGANPDDVLFSISCLSAGNCSAGGRYLGSDGSSYRAFTVTSVDGEWGLAEPVEFPDDIGHETSNDRINSVSCSAIDTCAAVGEFKNSEGSYEGFAVNMTDGTWGIAHPAYVATESGHSRGADNSSKLTSVSCSDGGLCTAGGRIKVFDGGSEHNEIFVMSSNEAPPVTTMVPSSSTVAPSSTLPPPALDTVRALPPAPTPIVADNSIHTGETITVSFGGFTPFEYVQLVVASTPQVIGSGYANAQGVVTLTGNLPTNLTSGLHTLAVYAPGSGIGFTQPITVTALTLPTTGSSRGDGGAQVALWVLLAGIGAIVVARRRNA